MVEEGCSGRWARSQERARQSEEGWRPASTTFDGRASRSSRVLRVLHSSKRCAQDERTAFPAEARRRARGRALEVQRNGQWQEIAKSEVYYPGWDAHFRVENWDASAHVPYRVRHGDKAMFEGLIRRDPSTRT